MEKTNNLHPILWAWYLSAIAVILIMIGHFIVTTPYGRFSYDSLNYADVARNILRGRGIVQSAVGFNEADFSPDLPIPMPMTSQPPLYPLLVALLAWMKMPIPTAALLISVLGMILVVFCGIFLARQLYGDTAGLLAGIAMLAFAPIHFVAGRAWSDTLATGLTLLTISLLVAARRSQQVAVPQLILAGLCAGLAFATRYAFLILIPFGLLVLYRRDDHRCTVRSIEIFLVVTMFFIGLVIGRNLLIDGTLLGSARNPSTRDLLDNLQDAQLSMFGMFIGGPLYWPSIMKILNIQQEIPADQAITFSQVCIVILLIILLLRRKFLETLFAQQRFVLITWIFIYLGFLVLQRSLVHFDNIRARLAFPASIILVILLAGLMALAFSIRPKIAIFPILLLTFLGVTQAWAEASKPTVSQQEFIERSIADHPILEWINQNTSEEDLIIGDDPVDVVYYLNRDSAVSFSPWPYADHLSYETLTTFLQKHCGEYRNIYLYVRSLKSSEAHWQEEFGPFITDLAMDRTTAYPNVIMRIPHEKVLLYQLSCQR